MTETDYLAIRETLPVRTYVVDRRPWFDVTLRNVLAGTTLPEVFLVSNRPPAIGSDRGDVLR